jgi:hypothetical protein
MTREWLLPNVGQNLLGLAVASVLVAFACRHYIGRAESTRAHVVRAVVVPYLGCLAFLTLWNVMFWARTLVFGGLANLHDTMSLYVFGLVAVTLSAYVVIPYGILCQRVMHAVSPWRAA